MAVLSLVVDPRCSSLVYLNDPCIFATEADALLAQTPEPMEWDLLPATAQQALCDGVIDDEMFYLLLSQQEQPRCPDCSKPFIPTAEQRLEGRAQLVADTYEFIQTPYEITVIKPGSPSDVAGPYYITHPAPDTWLCTCPVFQFHPEAGRCKHLLAAICIKGLSLDYPEPTPPEPTAPSSVAPVWVRPVEVLPDAAALSKMGWDGTADSW